MNDRGQRGGPLATRRAVLGGAVAAGASLTGGCIGAARTLIDQDGPDKVTLTIKTVPADTDPVATRIARHLADNLEAAGVRAHIELMRRRELRRDILVDDEYQVYVGLFPGRQGPDALRPLLHSVYAGSRGWQNPFNFTDIPIDDLLQRQRARSGTGRRIAIGDLQREIASKQPFGILAFPREINAARTDRFVGWDKFPLSDPQAYLALERRDPDVDDRRLRVTTTNEELTRNLNPFAIEYRTRGTFTGLLYDPLGRRNNGAIRPWLAREWSLEQHDRDTIATINLRPGLQWHDGKWLTAKDVAFTYRFLNDTSLDEADAAIPAPRFHGRASLVDQVEARDRRTVELHFPDTSPEVARRALTVPILPAHIWKPKATEATFAGTDRYITEALVWSNPEPVGSGPVTFESRVEDESLVLNRFEDHFLHRDTPGDVSERIDNSLPFEQLSVRIVPSDHAAIELLATDEADATASSVDPSTVARIGTNRDLRLLVNGTRAFYHVGFNTGREPLGNPHFRRAVVRLIDKAYITEEILDGYARPATSPLAGTDWVTADLKWSGADPEVPFAGEDGRLDVQKARKMFRDAGFEYSEEGALLKQ
jgi:peptide/nickel transport system substrate-binding protein